MSPRFVRALMAALALITTPLQAQESAQDQVVWAAGALQRLLTERDYPTVLGLAAMNRALERGDPAAADGIRLLLSSLSDGSVPGVAGAAARCRDLRNPVEGTLCAMEALAPVLPAALAGDVAEEGARLVSLYFRPGEMPPGSALWSPPSLTALAGSAAQVLGGEGALLAPLQGFTESVLEDVWRLRDRVLPAGVGDASTQVATLVGGVLGFSPGDAAEAILPKVPELQRLVLGHPTLAGLHAQALDGGAMLLDGGAMLLEYRSFLSSIGGAPTALRSGDGEGAGALVRGLAELAGVEGGVGGVFPGGAADALVGALVDRTGADGLVEGLGTWAAQRSFVYLSARNAALSGLDAGVTERIRTLGNAAADLRREGLSFTANLSGLGQQAAMAVLSGNVFSVAAQVASFFQLTPGALGGAASEDVRALREGVEGMRAELGAGFAQVDGRFDEVLGVLDERFDRLESLVGSNHQEVREDLLSLQLGLGALGRRMDRMESNLQTYMQAGFDRDFSRTLVRCLQHRERHLPPHDQIGFAAFSECLTDFRVRAVQDARDALLTDRTTPVDDPALSEALADLSEENLAYRLPLLARAAQERFGYGRLLGGRGGVNAIEWSVATQAYLNMLEEWPSHALAVGPGDLEAILTAGTELQTIVRGISVPAPGDTRGGLLGRVMEAYEGRVAVLTQEADVLARRNQQAQLLRVDPASVLGTAVLDGGGGPELTTPAHLSEAVPPELRTAAVLALAEPRLVYRLTSADSVHRDGFRRSGLFRKQRHDRHTFTRTTVEVTLRLGDGRVAAIHTATTPSVLTRVEEMGGGATSDDVRAVRFSIDDVDAHFVTELWPALAQSPEEWTVTRPGQDLIRSWEQAIESELRRYETDSLGSVFSAVCQEGAIPSLAGDADRASALRIREALDGLTATRKLLGAYVRVGLPGTAASDVLLGQLLYGSDGLLDREALCRSVAAGESPLRVVWLDEEPRRRVRELSDLLAAALEREATLPGAVVTVVDSTVEQLRAALRVQQVRARIARGQSGSGAIGGVR